MYTIQLINLYYYILLDYLHDIRFSIDNIATNY